MVHGLNARLTLHVRHAGRFLPTPPARHRQPGSPLPTALRTFRRPLAPERHCPALCRTRHHFAPHSFLRRNGPLLFPRARNKLRLLRPRRTPRPNDSLTRRLTTSASNRSHRRSIPNQPPQRRDQFVDPHRSPLARVATTMHFSSWAFPPANSTSLQSQHAPTAPLPFRTAGVPPALLTLPCL